MLEERARLSGRTAVILGGAMGIGRSVTLSLAEAGVDIAFCDNDAARLRETEEAVRGLGRDVLAAEADVSDSTAVAHFYASVAEKVDRIDVVVNLAGGTAQRAFLDGTDAEDASDVRRNLGYVIQSTRLAVPHMQRGGSIINFTTIEAHRGAGGFSVYAAAKAATANLTRALAVEFGPRGIRVNAIAPDATFTEGNAKAMRPELMAQAQAAGPAAMEGAMRLYVPLGAPPGLDDIANAVLFLASDLAAAITGITLHVDGGTSASLGFLNWPYGVGLMPTAVGPAATALFAGEGSYETD